MIYTLTLNPAIDYVVQLDTPLAGGAINRSQGEAYQFGGKGINVSNVLRVLGMPTTALGFVAGFTGQALEQGLQQQGVETDLICVEDGMVKDFIMNDKCSAGTGRFLEIMSNTLGVKPAQLCELAEQGGGVSISSMCTVFAESEVISLIGRGESKENIAFGVVDSIVRKVASQASRLDLQNCAVCLTGGLCEFTYLRQRLEKTLGVTVDACPDARYAGAIGAALSAAAIRK